MSDANLQHNRMQDTEFTEAVPSVSTEEPVEQENERQEQQVQADAAPTAARSSSRPLQTESEPAEIDLGFVEPEIVIETALLTSANALAMEDLQRLFGGKLDTLSIEEALSKLTSFWEQRGLRLMKTSGGWRFQSNEAIAPYLFRMTETKPVKYSRSVLETLAIIAYRQPVTRGDIEAIRPVNPDAIRLLEERGWIEVIGHRETPGRPALFGTTGQFLDDLGLTSLADLPVLRDDKVTPETFELAFTEHIEAMQSNAAQNATQIADASEAESGPELELSAEVGDEAQGDASDAGNPQ